MDEFGEYDLKPERTFVLSDGTEAYGYRQGPYDFWKFKYERGMVPTKLQGTFTSFAKLKDAVTAYFKLKGIEVVKTIET